MRNLRQTVIGSLVIATFAAACGASLPPAGDPRLDGAPGWVTLGAGAFPGESTALFGIGAFSGAGQNLGIARSAAVGRGRVDLARQLQTRVHAMLLDYQRTTGNFEAMGEEQHVVDVSKQLTALTLRGAEPRESWLGPDGTFWALVVLDAGRFKEAIRSMAGLERGVQEAIVQRADHYFRMLDEEVERLTEAPAAAPPVAGTVPAPAGRVGPLPEPASTPQPR